LWVNLCKIVELPENAPNLALFGRKMALKWLKTCEFDYKPRQFPEYRKNTKEMSEVRKMMRKISAKYLHHGRLMKLRVTLSRLEKSPKQHFSFARAYLFMQSGKSPAETMRKRNSKLSLHSCFIPLREQPTLTY
jgi:hypothetical protein